MEKLLNAHREADAYVGKQAFERGMPFLVGDATSGISQLSMDRHWESISTPPWARLVSCVERTSIENGSAGLATFISF